MNSVLVTGARGFVASQLLRELGPVGLGTSRTPRAGESSLADLVTARPRRFDAIVHLAAVNPWDAREPSAFAANVDLAREVVALVRHHDVGKVVAVSTGGVFGYQRGLLADEAPVRPPNAYAQSKADAEAVLTEGLGERLVIVRPYFPYGRGQTNGLIAGLAARVFSGKPVKLNGARGAPAINPIFVGDLVRLLRLCVERDAPRALNAAGPDVVTIRELALAIGARLGNEPIFENGPEAVEDLIAATAALRLFDPTPPTSLDVGLSMTFKRGANYEPQLRVV